MINPRRGAMADSDRTVDFGFEKVAAADKAERVRAVFASVAGKYDVMNDLMSFGAHRLWKHFTLSLTGLRPGQCALDVAGGTGDLAAGLLRQVGKTRPRRAVGYQSGDAGNRPRPPARCGSRGQCRVHRGRRGASAVRGQRLRLRHHRLWPSQCHRQGGGAQVHAPGTETRRSIAGAGILDAGGAGLKPIYDAYSFKVLPLLGGLIAKDADSYRYLAESIRMHPDQETLLEMLRAAGFIQARYHNLSGGIVAVHRGYKI